LKDPLAVGLGSVAAGVGLGGGALTLAQIVVSVLQGRLDPTTYQDRVGDPLVVGLAAAVLVGAGVGWYGSRAIDNLWQRGVIGVLSAVGAILVGFVAAPVDRFFGLVGMLVWLAASVAFGIAGSRWAMKGSREQEAGSGL
jgi:NhaP-type Na+/H+ or K+/H+ antiporter